MRSQWHACETESQSHFKSSVAT